MLYKMLYKIYILLGLYICIMSSSDYQDAFLELDLNNTLGKTSPVNPLDTVLSQKNNLEDPNNKIRESLKKQINSMNPLSIPPGDLLNIEVSNAFLCWIRVNNSAEGDNLNGDAEEVKRAMDIVDLLSDPDPNVSSHYMLFLKYVSENTKRYLRRTKEYALMSNYNPSCSDSIKHTYESFRKYYFDLTYKPLYNNLFPTLFKNGTDGWYDINKIFQDTILTPFRNLNIDTTYGTFLDNMEAIIGNLHDFLISTGPMGQFITNQYSSQSFAGQNVCKFDDKLECLLCKFQNISNTVDQNGLFIRGDNNDGTTTTNYFGAVLPVAGLLSSRSILTSIIEVLRLYILHLADKFIPRIDDYGNNYPPLTDSIIITGAQTLSYLYAIVSGYSDGGGSIQMVFSESCSFTDAQLDIILGDISITTPNEPVLSGGWLKFVIQTLRTLLSSSDDIIAYGLGDINDSPPTYARISSSFFTGAFQLDWLNQVMADSTYNIPSYYPISKILTMKPQNMCDKNISLESEILDLFSVSNLKQAIAGYVNTYLNHIEGLNMPSQDPYVSFTLTGNISSYDSVTFNDFIVEYSGDPSASYELYTFISDCKHDKLIFDNSNIKCTKYYSIALINYMLYAITRNALSITPTLVLDDLTFNFNNLNLSNNPTYTYTNNTQSTNDLNKLFYMVASWNIILYNAFYGSDSYFDPINLPDQTVCINWVTTPLIQQLFYLSYKFDICFLNRLVTDTVPLTITGSSANTLSNFNSRIANQERITKTNL